MQACIQSFLEAFSLFLAFSVQTKQKTLHLNGSRSEQQQQQQQQKRLFNAEIHLPNSNWFDRLCSCFCFTILHQCILFLSHAL